jgi:L-xylulokinase
MKRLQYLMGIDNGGSNIKCAIFDTQGKEITAVSAAVPVSQPSPGFVERDPEEVWRCNCTVIHRALHAAGLRPDQIAAVSLCGYGGGVCLLDRQGHCVYPIVVSTDVRAGLQTARLNAASEGEKIFSITHQRLWEGQPAALLNWFSAERPGILDQAHYALPIKDYIRGRLTQEYTLELTDASNNGLIDPADGTLSGTLLELSGLEGLRRLFDYPILTPSSIAGRITPQAAEETGLMPGTPVVAGSYDVSACTIGCGALDSSCLALTNGTWTMASYLDTGFSHAAPSTLVTISPLHGYYLLEQGGTTGTANLNWYLDRFLSKIYPDRSKQQLYELCAQTVSSVRTKDDIVFVPHLYTGATGSDSKGAFFGLAGHHDELDLLYAVMEGILLSVQRHIQRLEHGRAGWKELRMSGGVSASRPWSQMLCDLLQTPVSIMAGSEQGARGAAMYAGVGVGIFSDLREAAEEMSRPSVVLMPQTQYADVYRRKAEQYECALNALDQFHRLS